MPAADFISLADAKAFMGITGTSGDPLLSSFIAAATAAIIAVLGWDPNQQQTTELSDGYGRSELVVRRGCVVNGQSAISAVSQIACVNADGSLVPYDLTSLYIDDPIVGLRLYRFPMGRRNISITYTSGFSPIPQDLWLAEQMTVKAMWVGKNVDQHVTGEEYDGVIAAQFWQTGPGSVPPQARSLLAPYLKKMIA
jgi:hypothetical protein